jgi:hypothetical protein
VQDFHLDLYSGRVLAEWVQLMQGSGLPSLTQSRLNAPRILKMGKVSQYVISKLEETEHARFVAYKHYCKSHWQSEKVTPSPP